MVIFPGCSFCCPLGHVWPKLQYSRFRSSSLVSLLVDISESFQQLLPRNAAVKVAQPHSFGLQDMGMFLRCEHFWMLVLHLCMLCPWTWNRREAFHDILEVNVPYLLRCRPVAETQEGFILHFWTDTICREYFHFHYGFSNVGFHITVGGNTPESLTGPWPSPCQAPAEKASGGRLEAMQVMLESLSPQQRGQSVARRALLSACEAPWDPIFFFCSQQG